MKRADAVSGILLTAIGLYAALKAHTFGLGELKQPGAGFFPFLGAVLVVTCSAGVVVNAFARRPRGAPADEAERLPAANWGKIFLCVAALLVYPAVLPWVGFSASTFLLMLALSRFESSTTWRGSIAISTLGALAFWLLFVRILGVRFPAFAMGL